MAGTPFAYLHHIEDEILNTNPNPYEAYRGRRRDLRREREHRRGRAGQPGGRRMRSIHQVVQAEENACAREASSEEDDQDDDRRDNMLPVMMGDGDEDDGLYNVSSSHGGHNSRNLYSSEGATSSQLPTSYSHYGEYSPYPQFGHVQFAPSSFQYPNYATPASAVYNPTQQGSSYQYVQPHIPNFEARPSYNVMPSNHPIQEF